MSIRILLALAVLVAIIGCKRTPAPIDEINVETFDVAQPSAAIIGVSFAGNPMTDADLQEEMKELPPILPNLTRLNLSETKVTDAGMKHVRELKGLQRLYLRGTEVGDAGLLELKHLEQIAELDVGACKSVSDDSLEFLNGLKQLTVLKIDGTRVTTAGFAELRKAHPTCRIDR